MRVASIDIGTNTVLLLVAQRDPKSGYVVAVREEATITRLGEGVDRTHALAPGAIARTNDCLTRYAGIIDELGVGEIDVVGTSAMRDTTGGEGIRDRVRELFGIEARVLSGDEEARVTFRGATSGIDELGPHVIVFDIGGGSTEIVEGDNEGTLSFAKSYDVGSVRLTERFIQRDPPAPEELAAVRHTALSTFGVVPHANGAPVIGIAGTVTTLAAISLGLTRYDHARVHGATLQLTEIENVVGRLAGMSVLERQMTPGLEPKRADVIVAGGLIVLSVMAAIRTETIRVSDRGVRWGVAEELLDAI